MKRKLVGLLCACMLFTGCGSGSSQPLQTDPSTAESLPAQTCLPLLEQGIELEESSNLLYIPNALVESMTDPEIRLFGNGLLLSECTEHTLVLKHISLENGTLVKSASFPAALGTKLYIGSGEIGLCDRESGLVSVLDENFHLLRTYPVPQEGDDWYLSSELDTLYVFYHDRGLLARNLETGAELWLVDNGFRVAPKGSGSSYVIFEYTDRTDQKTYTRCLNLSTATLETLPMGGAISSGIRQNEIWLLRNSEADGVYTVVGNESANCFVWTDSAVRLLSPRRHLLAADASGRNLTLYETDGSFLSQCSLPQNSNAVDGSDFVWSGYWEGYFFADYMDDSCRLMFWDVFADTEGENLQMTPAEQTQQPQMVPEQQLYERAEELSARFGVDIRIAEQCALDYSSYDAYAIMDPVFIREALDLLEECLSMYPEGFFRQLTFGTIGTVRFELAGGLTTKDGIDNHPPSVGGFAQNLGSYYLIALDGYTLMKQTVFHEVSHVIDARLKWDSMIREDALYSEDAWLALQPEGFHYAMSYTEIPAELLHFTESGYFITDYSLTYPTEDRATLMEAAMSNFTWNFEAGSGTRRKLQYYADCIRNCFDTEGWPQTTLWEQVLQ